MLTIAHRLQTIITSDRIAVIDQGRVVEYGKPADLSKDKKTAFYKFIQTKFKAE